MERLMLSFISILYVVHILTCVWLMVGKEAELTSHAGWMTHEIRDWDELS